MSVEALLVGFLSGQLHVRVATEVPADLTQVAPVVQVVRVGGGSFDDDPGFTRPTVDIAAFHTSRGQVSDLADAVDDALRRALPGQRIDGVTVTKVRTITGPSWRPWDDTSVRRFGAAYELYLKH